MLAALITVSLSPSQAQISSLAQRAITQETAQTKDTGCGVPFWTELNVVVRNFPASFRLVFVYVEPQSFTQDNLRRIFVCLSQKYTKPEYLLMKVRSDKTSLQRWIKHYLAVHSVRADGSFERQKYRPIDLSSDLMNEVGFYQADYDRTDSLEGFTFSSDPTSPVMTRVTLASNRRYRPSGDPATDLVRASTSGLEEQVRVLLHNGTSVNSTNKYGVTPLIAAILWSHVRLVSLLIENGANVNQGDPDGWTPLMCALTMGEIETAEHLLRAGANVNARADNGDSALIIATERESLPMVQQLLDKGADIKAKDRYGRTPLMIAEERGSKTAMAIFKEAYRKK